MTAAATPLTQAFFHGTKPSLKPGEFIGSGHSSNYGAGKSALFAYMTATMDAAIWGADLAAGEAPGRIFVVEPTGLCPLTAIAEQHLGHRRHPRQIPQMRPGHVDLDPRRMAV
jgi:hypothetical protein